MRLKQIKLAGFKSFVDPTKIPFEHSLSAVVGPNGCGKSNVIDAVRWVLGESSAKHLRGDSMTDVIFNGSSARRPISVASVELTFENIDGRLSGQYASYQDIAVKRQVNRDSESTYFLNGQKCRRKDITDLFMGTGLGPRSYAIIEQGTISRLIESKPQELRVFIEEAAGISRYKERRRETENRIRHTRENLERLNDIRSELAQQIEKLAQQAQAARQYRKLKHQEREYQSQLQVLRLQELQQQADKLSNQIQQLEKQLAQVTDHQRQTQTSLLQLKQQISELSQSEQTLVEQFYACANETTRLEQQLEHQQQQDSALQQRLTQLTEQIAVLVEQASKLDDELKACVQKQAQLTPKLSALEEEIEICDEQIYLVEDQSEQTLQEVTRSQQQVAKVQTDLAVQQSMQTQQQQQIEQDIKRREDLQQQLQQLNSRDLDANIEQLSSQHEAKSQGLASMQQQIAQLTAERDDKQSGLVKAQQDYQHAKQSQASLTARRQLIEELLAKHQLQHKEQAVWQCISVKPGWEVAADNLLMNILALPVSTQEQAEQGMSATTPHAYADDIVQTPLNLHPWLSQVHWVEDTQQALKVLQHAEPAAICVTPQGEIQGHGFCFTPTQGSDSVLALSHEFDALNVQVQQANDECQRKQSDLSQLTQQVSEIQLKLSQLQGDAQQLQQWLASSNVQMATLTQQRQDISHRIQDNQARISQLTESIELGQQKADCLNDHMDDLNEQLQRNKQAHEQCLQGQQDALGQLKQLKQLRQTHLQGLQQLNQQQQHNQTQQALTSQKIEQHQEKQQSANEQHGKILATLQANEQLDKHNETSVYKQQLQVSLAKHQQLERSLADNRLQQAQLQEQVDSSLLIQKQQLEQDQDLTQSLGALKLRREGINGQIGAQVQLLDEHQVKVSDVLSNLPHNAKISTWTKALEQVKVDVAALGAINLAAIEEFDTQSERKNYLDEQDQDLTQALGSLESAIKKIDRETRSRFKATFEAVNQDLQQLFPKVFGGGRAYLALTDDDLLDTGVTIMAQPPGKKNSTIHLLSGGEKALTALSLVFAIFRLNPAPFCMLDEVDAPLDDANVGRFCRLLEEMSQSVQFIYISHNKITMEMAEQLIGVTMHEPGVSRIVAVDIDAAVAMADAV